MVMSPPARVVWIEMQNQLKRFRESYESPPARVVWIEMQKMKLG